MLWKKEFEIGDALIDAQHEELFKRVTALNRIVVGLDAAERKKECIDAILFLKEYALKHFAAEEQYQEFRNYPFLEFHKRIHSTFVDNVLEAEKALVGSDFSLPVIKEFCGFLSMWLIYHVAGADQKIVTDDVITTAEFALSVSYEECVLEGMKDVLGTVLSESLDISLSSNMPKTPNDVLIEIDFDEAYDTRFIFHRETAIRLVNAITDLDMNVIDELTYAVLTQFAKTICNNVADGIGRDRHHETFLGIDEFFINTKYGQVSVSFIKK